MGLSNYPPGVSGNELELAGPSWEGMVERTCTAQNVQLKVVGAEPGTLIDVELDSCPWVDGEVEAWEYGGTLAWTCPVCGREYTEDWDPRD